MKKGLLTLLAASLVFVGCQNYDDQFDDLNAQISALKSQVDGLSSISGQVSALSATISGLQAGVAAAQASADAANTSASAIDLSGLSASLATLQAEVDAVQASLATAATASAVAALQVELDALEADLDDLLVSNNVYATDITITDAASMASALALGNKVALMNATVTITDASTVSDTDLQTFIDRIKTMNGNFVYSSGSATGYAPTFDKMVSAKAITVTTAGDISFKALTSATTITINDEYTTKNTSLDMGALTSLTSFTNDDGDTNTIELTAATNVDLASLTRHASTSSAPFTIITKKGATVDISSLDDVSTAGKQEDLYLSLNGAASYTSTTHAGGELTLTNVATATVSGMYGIIDVNAGVETLTVTDGVRLELDGATDLTTATLDFALDYDPDLTTANAAIAAGGYSSSYTQDFDDGDIAFNDLETLTITGDLLDLYIDGTELVTLSINATMHDLTISGATDLTTLTVAEGSKIGNINLTGTTNLKVADFNHTSNLTDVDKTAQLSVTFSATNNTALEKLHSTGDDVSSLTVTGNTALAELDFTGLKDDGAETTPATQVYVYDNNLTAASASNTKDGDTDVADGKTTDLGSFDNGTSGMGTLQAYLDHVTAVAAANAYVTFDKVSTLTNSESGSDVVSLNIEPSASGLLNTSAAANASTVLMMVPKVSATSNAVSATKGKRAFLLTAGGPVQFTVNSVKVPATAYNTTGNGAVDALNIASTANKDLASAAGLTLNALNVYASQQTVSLIDYLSNATASVGERYTNATVSTASTSTGAIWTVGIEDVFTLTVGGSSGNSVSVSPGSGGTTTIAGIEEDLKAAWATKYGASGTASLSAIATLVDGSNDGLITIQMLQKDSGGHNVSVQFGVSDKKHASGQLTRTAGNIGYKIGTTASTADNSTVATTTNGGLIITFESKLEGVTDAILTGVVSTGTNPASTVELTTNYSSGNSTWSGYNTYAGRSAYRTDVVNVVAAVANTNSDTPAIAFDRTAWIG